MSDEIQAVPKAYKVSELTPIILQESPNVQIKFCGLQVDNTENKSKNIKGTLVIKKKTSKLKTFEEESKFSKKDISSYDRVEIALETEQTYALAKGLFTYYKIFGGKFTNPFETVSYIKKDDEVEQLKAILSSSDDLLEVIGQIDTSTLNMALNLNNLKKLKVTIENNLDNGDESFWQEFFESNSWALSQMFSCPFMIFKGAKYVGGKSLLNTGGKNTDFIYKNLTTNNVALIEIKTPTTNLLSNTKYRQDVNYISEDLSSSVSQLLTQKSNLYESYTALRSDTLNSTGEDFIAANVKSILLIGKIKGLSPMQIKQLELYRNELKSIEIICFDELLEKVNSFIELLSK